MSSLLQDFGDSCSKQSISVDHRFHLQHGPIDLVIDLRGSNDAIHLAEQHSRERFATVLEELTSELNILRQPVRALINAGIAPQGVVAKRMWEATNLFADRFITPMAAVAGAVADEIQQALLHVDNLHRSIVNNGGDIALWGVPGEHFSIGIVDELSAALNQDIPARVCISASSHINGVATSGWRGRSQSLGIADAVTVFANNASVADAAATLIANEVNVQSASVLREPANNRYPDSDLGEQFVTLDVQTLSYEEISSSLAAGMDYANSLLQTETILAAVIVLQGNYRALGQLHEIENLTGS